jgi:hypothetical protein
MARYNPVAELKKENVQAVREGMKLVKRSAKNFEGSRLRKRTGKSARGIGTRVRAPRTRPGIEAKISAGWLIKIWETGRRAYEVRPKTRKALSLGPDWLVARVSIPAADARPVLMPAVEKHLGTIERMVATASENAAAKGITRTIKVRKSKAQITRG